VDVLQTLVFSPAMPVGHPVVTLEEFAAFPLLKLLSVMLQSSRGWEAGWRCEFSPALQGESAASRTQFIMNALTTRKLLSGLDRSPRSQFWCCFDGIDWKVGNTGHGVTLWWGLGKIGSFSSSKQ
jgi:hypothetical protein